MSSEFNAYSTWLGIPEDEQPPHYYRLLGLEPFESDPDVIRQAGQRILGLVKAREKGSLGAAARRLKAEVTFAAACLLDEKKKAQYDRELDAWFNEFDSGSGSGDDYELEEPDLPMAKIVQREKSATKSKSGSGKSKSGSSVKASGSKASGGKTKAAETKTETKKVGKKSANTGLIVGLAAAVIAIIGLGGGLAYVFMKPAKTVAKAPDKAKTPEVDPDEEDDVATKKPAVDDEEKESGKKETGKKEPATATDPDEEAEDEKKPVPPAGAEKAPGEKTADPAKADPDKTKTPDPMVTGEKPAETPMPMPMATPMPMAAPAGQTPAPMPPASTVAKTETPPPAQPATPPDPKMEDPFRELVAETLELPPLVADAPPSTEPVVLATLYPQEAQFVNVKLIGGEVILGKEGEFKLTGSGHTDPEPKWEIKFIDTNKKSIPVANLAYKANKLSFAWTGQGPVEINNSLRNCKFNISVGLNFKKLALRKPQTIEPLTEFMTKNGKVMEFDAEGLPLELDKVSLEITRLGGGFPEKPDYSPGATIKPVKQSDICEITFAKLDLAFKAQLQQDKKTGKLKLDFRPMLRSEPIKGKTERRLKPYVIRPMEIQNEMDFTQNKINFLQTKFEEFKKTNPKPEDLAQGEVNLQGFTDAEKTKLKLLGELKTAIDTLEKEGKVYFRVYVTIGDYSLDLLKTRDDTPAEPAKTEPAKK